MFDGSFRNTSYIWSLNPLESISSASSNTNTRMFRGSEEREERGGICYICSTYHTRHSGQPRQPTKQLTEGLSIYHIVHTARCPNHNVLPHLQFGQVSSDISTSDTGMALGVHVVTQGNNHLQSGREGKRERGKEGKAKEGRNEEGGRREKGGEVEQAETMEKVQVVQ